MIKNALVIACLVAGIAACDQRGDQNSLTAAQRSMNAYADTAVSSLEQSSNSERQAFVQRFRSLTISAFYDLVQASAPRGDVAIGSRTVNNFADALAARKSVFDALAQTYGSVGELIDREKLAISLPAAKTAIVSGVTELYEAISEQPALALRSKIPEDEQTNECVSSAMMLINSYECYGDYKVTDYRQRHIEEHLGPSPRPKRIHSIFTNAAVIGTLYDQLRTGAKPFKGPLKSEENGNYLSWYKINNAGTNSEQYVQLVTRPNNVVVTAYPVTNPAD